MINKLLINKEYRESINKIKKLEEKRKFCKHGIEHALDVARIGYIISLEEGYNINKEEIYLAALLHDIGRGDLIDGRDHHYTGFIVASKILQDIGCSKDKIEMICSAIKNHKYVEKGNSLDYIIYKADKLSRACYDCNAIEECYWNEEVKNIKLTY